MATAGQRRLTNVHDSQRRPTKADVAKQQGGSRRVGLKLPRYIFFFYFTPTNVYLDYVTFTSDNNEKRQRRTVSRDVSVDQRRPRSRPTTATQAHDSHDSQHGPTTANVGP